MDFTAALSISAAGMDVQGTRLRVIAENLANQDTTGSAPGADPYRRKVVTFEDRLDRSLEGAREDGAREDGAGADGAGDGVSRVRVKSVGTDESAFPTRYDPSHPAANADGYVKTPNVDSFTEVMDMREAQRSYNANLSVMQVTRSMLTRTIEMLK